MHRRCQPIGLLLLLLAGCAPLWSLVVPEQRSLDIRDPAQLPQAPLEATVSPETVSNPTPATIAAKELSLDEAIRIALANSKVIRVLAGFTAVSSGQTIYDPAITNTDIDIARSVFDPAFFINNSWSRLEPPLAFANPIDPLDVRIAGTRTDDYLLDTGVSKRNALGGTTKLEFNDSIARFHPGLFPLNPQEQTALSLSYTQPLLRGVGIAANTAPIVIARINTERSYFQFKDSVQEMVRGVIEAYWNVVFAKADVEARQIQVDQTQEAYKLADGKFRAGIISMAPVAQAKAALSTFQANLIGAKANLLRLEAALRNILGLPPTEPARLVLTTAPSTSRSVRSWDEIIALAQELRPDLIELKLIIEADQQTIVLANNQARPQVDAAMFYRWNGLEGRTPSGVRLETGAGEFTDWTLGVNFSVPLGLRKDRAALRRAELVILRDQANLEQGLHAALHTLAGNMRNLAQYYDQYKAFTEAEIASEINYKQQKKAAEEGGKVDGKAVIYLDVLQAISSLADARSAKAQALTQYNTELANLERQTGTILDTHGVRFMEERFRAIGPLGRHGPGRDYPATVMPGPNVERYVPAPEPNQADAPAPPK